MLRNNRSGKCTQTPHRTWNMKSKNLSQNARILQYRKKISVAGVPVKIDVPNKYAQIFLACTTLLFFASFECLIYTALIIPPGLFGRSFKGTQCTVETSLFNGNTSCRVSSFLHHGETRYFPCLQIYVVPKTDNVMTHKDFKNNSTLLTSGTTRLIKTDAVARMASPTKHNLKPTASEHSEVIVTAKVEQRTTTKSSNPSLYYISSKPRLLFQHELNFFGTDQAFRRCSYLPTNCPHDINQVVREVKRHAFHWGKQNSSFKCFYDTNNDERVLLKLKITNLQMCLSAILPLLGICSSTVGCVVFWRQNYKKFSRLYIYNSWASS
ncbi:uncharacterized protein LOC143467007 isoform X2 [Clavelina lepadiformis]|uniref:uncharacterized protein LOC143467007 isoform X2 n=1 Tax=Clavelina lepadiformis TaxID=159417 RepID=UPI0040426D07